MSRGFQLFHDADLRPRNSFGVPARAPLLVEVEDHSALPEVLALPALRDTPALVLGGGSNLLFADDPTATVLALSGKLLSILHDDGERAIVRADAGVNWHACVQWTLSQRLCGLENLSLIPGTVGAAPIQNIGAYGVEIQEHVHAVEAWDSKAGQLVRLDRANCDFAYRDSRFKREPDRWIVVAVEFALSRTSALRLDYAGLAEELKTMGIADPDAAQVADAVVRIRRRKLPDPAVIGNAGSFFKNPVVPSAIATTLKARHPALPVFPLALFPADAAAHHETGAAGLRKLSAAWLIDDCGWKGHRDGDAGVSENHALVLVNHGTATGAQLLALARKISESVQTRFGVVLEPEPRIIGAAW